MPDDWDEHDDIAAGSSCPMPNCGELAVAYRSTDGVGRDHSEPGVHVPALRNRLYRP